MKIYAYIAAAALLAGVLGYGIQVVKKANRAEAAEAALATANANHTAYVEKEVKQLAEFTRQAQADRADDAALTARITALEDVAAKLGRAARALPATVEKPDAKGVTRLAIDADWGLCYFAFLSGDPTDSAACQTRAAVNGDLQLGERPLGVQVPPAVREP